MDKGHKKKNGTEIENASAGQLGYVHLRGRELSERLHTAPFSFLCQLVYNSACPRTSTQS